MKTWHTNEEAKSYEHEVKFVNTIAIQNGHPLQPNL